MLPVTLTRLDSRAFHCDITRCFEYEMALILALNRNRQGTAGVFSITQLKVAHGLVDKKNEFFSRPESGDGDYRTNAFWFFNCPFVRKSEFLSRT